MLAEINLKRGSIYSFLSLNDKARWPLKKLSACPPICLSLFQNARLIGRNHVFDVDEGIRSSSFLQDFKCFLYQVPDILVVSLVVVNAVSGVEIVIFENVEYR